MTFNFTYEDFLPMELEHLARAYERAQRHRIRLGNVLSANERGDSVMSIPYLRIISDEYERAEQHEQLMKDYIIAASKDHPMWEHVISIFGMGPVTTARLLSMIDIKKAHVPSGLLRFAGVTVVDGQAQRRRRGQKNDFCAALRTLMHLISASLIRGGSPYRHIYDISREKYRNKLQYEFEQKVEEVRARRDRERVRQMTSDFNKTINGHAHMRALRVVKKIFLQHLWVTWRMVEGLPICLPYHFIYGDHRKHDTYYDPPDYGWPEFTSLAGQAAYADEMGDDSFQTALPLRS